MLHTAQPNGTSTSIAFLNVCSLRYKVHEVQSFLAARGVTLFAMAETWLTSRITDGEVHIPHYRLFRKDRAQRNGG